MKKNSKNGGRAKPNLHKGNVYLRKLHLLLISLVISALPSPVSAQNTRINLQMKNASLVNVFQEIKKQTELSVVYSITDIDANKRVDVDAKNEELIPVLDRILKSTDLTYSLKDNYLIFSKKAAIPQKDIQKNTISISGTILDIERMPLIGVSVVAKGTTHGTITDIDGRFELQVPPNTILTISYVGHEPQEVAVNNRTKFDIVLLEDSKLLDEVVVVGYGTMQKRAVTSSISSIKGSDLTQGMGGSTIATALQGKVSGLTISGTSSPNATNDFQLRGVASINASQGPLIVIDGIPGGDFRSLQQEDIESIDVLKDASAGAIYGTRATGGVILITTKQGSAHDSGTVKMTYTGEFSTESVRRRPQVLSSTEYMNNVVGAIDYGSDTDWYHELTNDNPFSQKHVLNISGGTSKARIYTSFTYSDQEGISIGDNRKDYAGRINTNFSLMNGLLDVKTHAEYREAGRDRRISNGNYYMAMWLNPTEKVYDPMNTSGFNVITNRDRDYNPVADVMLKTNYGKDKWTLADASFKLNITSDISTTATIGYQGKQYQNYRYVSAYHKASVENNRRGEAYHGFSKDDDILFESYANYTKTFNKKHDFNAVAGYSFWETNGESFNMTNWDFPVEALGPWDMGSGSYISQDGRNVEMNSEKDVRERLIAFFGRANYSYDDKYMTTLTYRREGSSKFGRNNRWGDFWSISGGWRISKEPFMKDIKFINDLKLRAGYGVTGNNGFDAGNTQRMYKSNQMWYVNDQYTNNWHVAYGSVANVNADLRWEEKKEYNIGLDYDLLNGRLFGKFDIYKRKIDGLLYSIGASQPPMLYDKIMKNVGNLQNTGWEFEIGGTPVKNRDFSYTTTLRLSHNKTTIKSLDGSTSYIDQTNFPAPGSPGTATRLSAGGLVGAYYIHEYAGLDEDGKFVIYDNDGVKVYASDAKNDYKRYIGNAIPKLIASWDHSFQYKNWDLSIFLRSWIDYDVFNTINMYFGINVPNSGQNYLKRTFGNNKDIKDSKHLNSFWLEDGTFLKIDAINLAYRLNLKKYIKYVDNARFYLTVRDVATFTKYSGMDPEVNINGLEPGFEWFNGNAIYPKTRRYTLGVQLTF